MISQTRINSELALYPANQHRNFFPESAAIIMRNIIPRQHHHIGFQKIDTLYTIAKIFTADGSAAMQIAHMNYAHTGKNLGKISQI